MPNDSNLLDTKQAAAYLHIHPNTISNWRSNRRVELPYVKLGGAVRYRLQDLAKFVERNMRREPAGESE